MDNLSAAQNQPIGLYGCHTKNLTNTSSTQFFLLTKSNEIRLKGDSICWDVIPEQVENGRILVKLFSCHHQGGNQYFEYDSVRFSLYNENLR